MSCIDERRGAIVATTARPFSDVKKGYTYFEEGDVLFAKITPCMQNGKHAIARNLIEGVGFGTTEFHVLRPGPLVTPDWVHHYLRQPSVLREATTHFIGSAGQQRVPDSYLAALNIPLPAVDEQQRIAAMLQELMARVDRARAATEAQLEAAKAMPAAYLRAVFNSPEAQRWPTTELSQACDSIEYGFTASADFEVKEPRFLRITDIQDGWVEWERVPGCRMGSAEESRYSLIDGDIVFARTGATTGKSYLIRRPPRAVFASYLIRIRPSHAVGSDYLYAFFQSDGYWQQVRMNMRGGAQPNVNATLLGALTVPLPPLSEQARIVAGLSDQIAAAEEARRRLEEQLAAIEALPAALLRRAFSGEL